MHPLFLLTSVTLRYAQDGTTTSAGIVCKNLKLLGSVHAVSSVNAPRDHDCIEVRNWRQLEKDIAIPFGQFTAQSVQEMKVRFWQPPQAEMREYVTVLHRQTVASAEGGAV
jgi:hypothetical protein